MSPSMPWGKHRGQPITAVPAGYLAWVLESGYVRDPQLAAAIRAELAQRLGLDAAAPPPPPPAWGRVGVPPRELAPVLGELLATGYKALALKRHPDRGGTTAEMQALNRLRDYLRKEGWRA